MKRLCLLLLLGCGDEAGPDMAELCLTTELQTGRAVATYFHLRAHHETVDDVPVREGRACLTLREPRDIPAEFEVTITRERGRHRRLPSDVRLRVGNFSAAALSAWPIDVAVYVDTDGDARLTSADRIHGRLSDAIDPIIPYWVETPDLAYGVYRDHSGRVLPEITERFPRDSLAFVLGNEDYDPFDHRYPNGGQMVPWQVIQVPSTSEPCADRVYPDCVAEEGFGAIRRVRLVDPRVAPERLVSIRGEDAESFSAAALAEAAPALVDDPIWQCDAYEDLLLATAARIRTEPAEDAPCLCLEQQDNAVVVAILEDAPPWVECATIGEATGSDLDQAGIRATSDR